MAYKKPQNPLINNGFGIYPLTTADQVILSDGSRLEKNGVVSVNVATAANSEKLGGKTWAERLLDIYPIGSIYISVNSTSPASLFGGTWEQLQDRFLLGAGSTYSAGSTGGEATHKLTIAELPSHSHNVTTLASWGKEQTLPAWSSYVVDGTIESAGENGKTDKFWEYALTLGEGSGAAHNNMPPYLAVYMWKRVS